MQYEVPVLIQNVWIILPKLYSPPKHKIHHLDTKSIKCNFDKLRKKNLKINIPFGKNAFFIDKNIWIMLIILSRRKIMQLTSIFKFLNIQKLYFRNVKLFSFILFVYLLVFWQKNNFSIKKWRQVINNRCKKWLIFKSCLKYFLRIYLKISSLIEIIIYSFNRKMQ